MGIFQGPGTVFLKGIGGHLMKEVFVSLPVWRLVFKSGFSYNLN